MAVSGNLSFAKISAGNSFTCGLTTSGAAYCWGTNYYGQLGDGSQTNSPVPIVVAQGIVFEDLAAGGDKSYCWGDNGEFQLGTPTPSTRQRGFERSPQFKAFASLPLPLSEW